MRLVSWDELKRDFEKNFRAQDKLKPSIRALIYEYGFNPVRDLYNEGYRDAAAMREQLEAYRVKREQEWHAQIPFPRTV